MNSENFFVGLGVVCATLVLLSPAACSMHEAHVIDKAVQRGADPIAVRCALDSAGGRQEPICVIKAMEARQ